MNRIVIIGILSIAVITAVVAFSMRYTYFSSDPNDFPEIVDRKPLKYLKNEPNAKYILVRTWGDKIEYIDDYSLLSENKDIFIVTNSKNCYFTTASGAFVLYKDGEKIDDELFGESGGETIKINYGTLEQAFKQINSDELEKMLNEQ